MRLYHFTEAKNLVGISIRGLAPQPCGPLTMGQEVVWLSTQENLRPTQADLDWGAVHPGGARTLPRTDDPRV